MDCWKLRKGFSEVGSARWSQKLPIEENYFYFHAFKFRSMKKLLVLIFLFPVLSVFAQEKEILSKLDAKADFYGDLARQIWSNPELGYLETNSSQLLQ